MNKRLLFWTIAILPIIFGMFMYWGTLAKENSSPNYKTTTGNLSEFILSEIIKNGAHLTNTAQLGKCDSRWSYAKDDSGFQIYLPSTNVERLVQALAPVMGQPERRLQYPHIIFRNPNLHAFVFIGTNTQTRLQQKDQPQAHLICLRAGALEKIIASRTNLNRPPHNTNTFQTPTPTPKSVPSRSPKPTNTIPLPSHVKRLS
jgi:hypothetical protein